VTAFAESPLFQGREETVGAVEREGHFGMSVKFTSWLATVAPAAMKPACRPNQLHERDAVLGRSGLGVRGVENTARLLQGGEEPEGAGDVLHVVVDGLGIPTTDSG